MIISSLKTNHVVNPLGFEFDRLSLSWVTESEDSSSIFQSAAKVEIAVDPSFETILFDSGKSQEIDSLAYHPDIKLKPRTRYYWRVTVWGDAGDEVTSESAWFETAKMDEPWEGKWISPELDKEIHPLIRKTFSVPSDIESARAYICGVGLYDVEINGIRVSNEYFAPGYNAYDFWLQYQTYDVTDLLKSGENAIGFMLGNGWYKGRFGFEGGYHELYGSEFACIGEIVVTLKDGSTTVIATDEDWKCAPAPITFSGIYDGEIYDANLESKNWTLPEFDDSTWTGVRKTEIKTEKCTARRNLPVKIMEERKPIEILHTPAGEVVLDFGQVMTGWVRFKTKASKGTTLQLQYGEILQNGNFYRENLREAKAEYIYIADESVREVQPHFTFYGFRYVKLTGFEGDINLDDFTGCVIYSEIEQTGTIETSNPLVNQLFLNTVWGQKGNFLDVPTDCPQRDERMGWTGDAQVFAPTACFNMYSPAFYQKYMFDLHEEQKRLSGSVPFTVPVVKPKDGNGFISGSGSAAWGDAATVIPWTLYTYYGDKELLRQQFDTMKDWVDYIKKVDDESGAKRLWQVGFHFGDWLALDGKDPQSPMGGTDSYYIASAYYCYSAQLVAKAAKVIGINEMAEQYGELANEIKEAIRKEYFTPNGRSALNTQTAMIVALYMDLIPESFRPRLIDDLKAKLREDKMHLNTGFVGTPYFCNVLSEYGANDFAYTLLLNDDFPSWLYAVKLGATTIWERWNSVLPDGSISGTGMNSLNHYAYGSIAEWMYRYMCGINPVEEAPGFRKFKLCPKPYGKVTYAKAKFSSPSGDIESGWELKEDGRLTFTFTVPFNTNAEVVLPDASLETIKVNGELLVNRSLKAKQENQDIQCELSAGTYVFDYLPTISYILTYSTNSSLKELLNNEETKEIVKKDFPEIVNNPIVKNDQFVENSLQELINFPLFTSLASSEKLDELNKKLVLVRQ
ncbi:family 78 glycoside hydrolase catalytic domain [Bacillus sp. ISL-75]|uniref:alpha-L-rhamnosidase n=1 Tax=Bacillus sp. ISL-75 TaxID=2819137 RepID=UPI001BE8E1C8|nr:alpha-L-rhamnosidase [Bacillus sp. ISL-75]MBT2725814.1 family 78 glycoside hydrolase catalytic domain [Bacillus sp. ISL-75]